MEYNDVVSQQQHARIYQVDFFLWKQQWDAYTTPPMPLNWQRVKFENGNASEVPTKKGVYGFFIEPRLPKFPSHGYLIYIGQAGYKGKRHLRKRFADYLQDKNKPKRTRVNFMLNVWENYLYFYYAVVDTTQTNLKDLETQLLDTFTPPFNEIGYSAHVGKVIKGLK